MRLGYAKSDGYFALKLPGDPHGERLPNKALSQLRQMVLRAAWAVGAAVRRSAQAIGAMRFVTQIADCVVSPISVQVRDLKAIWTLPQKGPRHERVQGDRLSRTAAAKVNEVIAIARRAWVQQPRLGVQAADTTE